MGFYKALGKKSGVNKMGRAPTTSEKAAAFDMLMAGGIRPTAIIFQYYDELVGMPHDEMLIEIVRRTCATALVGVLVDKRNAKDVRGIASRKSKLLRSVAKKIKAGRRANG